MVLIRDKAHSNANAAVASASGMALLRPGSTRLLKAEEEASIVHQLSAMREVIDALLAPVMQRAPADTRLEHFDQRITYYQSLTDVDDDLAARVDTHLRRYNELKHTLVLANLPWVAKLARAQSHTTVSAEDLFQEGICGLLRAIDRFEVKRGLRLMTYATWYIREAMQQIRARQSHLISISSHDQTLLGQLEAHRTEFQHRHERAPRPEELSKVVNRPFKAVSRLQRATSPVVSLERGADDGTIPVVVDDPSVEFDRQEEVGSAVRRLLESLPSRERFIVTRRFGLDGGAPKSLEELGDDLHVTKERVRQLQRQAIRRLQQRAAEEQIEFLSA